MTVATLLAVACSGQLAFARSPGTDAATKTPTSRAADWVVVVRARADPAGVAKRHALSPSHRYGRALRGFAARLTASQRAALQADPDVAFVEPDRVVRLTSQVPPTSVDRIEADLAPAARIDGVDQRVDADVAIIDTGIQPDHPDLNVVGGHNCINSHAAAWSDGNGHGTHVAGIAAARDNGIGTVGVAPGARLWAVRVFDSTGYSRLSWILCGIDWVTGQRDPSNPTRPRFEVANMSLRDEGRDDAACGSVNHDAEHAAICRSVASGVTYVVAAGNDATSASRWIPAAYNEVITVSALADYNGFGGGGARQTCTLLGSTDADDTFANFSNYGWDIDLIAPGKCIRSTFPGSTYKVSSGTSMATPAVTGAAALYKSLHPSATPSAVRSALRAAGSLDWFYGTDPDGTHEPLLNVYGVGGAADDVAPIATAPVSLLASGSVITASGQIALRSSWTGRDDKSGVVHYDLQRSVDGGTYSTVPRPNPKTASALEWRVAGQSYQYRAKAFDHAGNDSGFVTAPKVQLTAVQSTSAAVSYGGKWTVSYNDTDYGGGTKYATTAGASARYVFSGRQIAWVAPLRPSSGSARVYVDGVYVTTVSLHSATTTPRRIVFQRTWPAVGPHVITIQVAGTQGHSRIDVDAFLRLS